LLLDHLEREKQVSIIGDEPSVHNSSRRSLKTDAANSSLNEKANFVEISATLDSTSFSEEHVQIGVGRWGCEWPS
jgi:hypothetical protein